MFRPDRSQRAPDPWLEIKLLLFMAGAVVGFAGMYLGSTPVIYIAIAILVVGFLLRFAPRGEDASEEEAEPEPGSEGPPQEPRA